MPFISNIHIHIYSICSWFQRSSVISALGKNLVLSFCLVSSGIILVLFIFIFFIFGQGWSRMAFAPTYPNGLVLKCKKSTSGQLLSTKYEIPSSPIPLFAEYFNKLHKWSYWICCQLPFTRFLIPSSPRLQSYIWSLNNFGKFPFARAAAPYGPKRFAARCNFWRLSHFLVTKCSRPFAVILLKLSHRVSSFGGSSSEIAINPSSPKSFNPSTWVKNYSTTMISILVNWLS